MNNLDELTKISSISKILSEMCSFDTSNPPGNEHKLAVFLKNIIEKYTSTTPKIIPVEKGRSNLVVNLIRNPKKPSILLLGHLDVVPAGNRWTKNPFQPNIKDNRLYARGSSDMKSGLLVFLIVFIKLFHDPEFRDNITMLFTCDEERNGSGIKKFIDNASPEQYKAIFVSEPTSNKIVLKERGALWLRIETKGISAHSSTPDLGKNAIQEMIKLYFAIKHGEYIKEKKKEISISLNLINGGEKENIVPEYCSSLIDIRYTPNIDLTDLRDHINKAVKKTNVESRLTYTLNREAFKTNKENFYVKKLMNSYFEITRKKAEFGRVNYFTDAAFFSKKDIPKIIFGPGEPDLAHKTNEFVKLSKIKDSILVYEEFLNNYSIKQS